MTAPVLTESQLNTLLRMSLAAFFCYRPPTPAEERAFFIGSRPRDADIQEDLLTLKRLGLIARAAGPGPGVTPSGWRITDEAVALMKSASEDPSHLSTESRR